MQSFGIQCFIVCTIHPPFGRSICSVAVRERIFSAAPLHVRKPEGALLPPTPKARTFANVTHARDLLLIYLHLQEENYSILLTKIASVL